MFTCSEEHLKYLKKIKRKKYLIIVGRISIAGIFIFLWELFSQLGMINTFLFSSPSQILSTFISLFQQGNLLKHVEITLFEVFLSFLFTSVIGLFIATILWSNEILAKLIDPYITILNFLPKVALGPLIIIWVGARIHSIIFMAIMISIFVTILTIYQGFISVNANLILMLKCFGANRWQIFRKIIFPSNLMVIISSLKINVSMSLIGVIMGELLVSKRGLGYLIMYGSQVFQIDLVITSVCILGIISYFMYYLLNLLESYFNHHINL